MAANFPVSERRTTDGSVINGVPTRGSKIAPVKSDMALKVVDNRVFDNISAQGSNVSKGLNDVPVRSDRSVVGQGVALNTVDFPVPPVSSVSNLSLDDRFLHFMDVMNSAVSEKLITTHIAPVQSTPIYTSSHPHSYAYVNAGDIVASTRTEVGHFDRRDRTPSNRRPIVLPDSSLDDDSDDENRTERKQSYAAKTPSRPKSYNQSCLKRHDTVQWEDEIRYSNVAIALKCNCFADSLNSTARFYRAYLTVSMIWQTLLRWVRVSTLL
jgi:hypothetical protein